MTVRRWAGALRSVLPGPRRTPFTFLVLLLLAATTAALRWSTSNASVLRWSSTNLVNLNHHPVSALLSSAFVSDGSVGLDFVVVALACAAIEGRSTTTRTALVITSGHVIASLVSEGSVRIAIAMHADSGAAARQLDVGISYVMYTAVGAVLGFLPVRWRRLGVRTAVAYLGGWFLLDPGMTTGGHVLSLAVGLVSWPFLMSARDQGGPAAVRPPSRFAWSRVTLSSRLRIGALVALTAAGLLTACSPGHYPRTRLGGAPHCAASAQCARTAEPAH